MTDQAAQDVRARIAALRLEREEVEARRELAKARQRVPWAPLGFCFFAATVFAVEVVGLAALLNDHSHAAPACTSSRS